MTNALDDWLKTRPEWRGHEDLLLVPPTWDHVLEECEDAVGCRDELFSEGEDTWTTFGYTRAAGYVQMRRTGSNHRFALMIVCQKPPGGMTDAIFFEGGKRLGDQYSELHAQRLSQIAEQHGYKPSPNDQYFPGLARFQGDPEAFVSMTQGRGYIKRLMSERGWACEGAVKTEHREPEQCPYESAPKLAPDLIEMNAKRFAEDNPTEARKMSRKEIRDHVVATHGSQD